jgi:hypothetical protein
MPPSPPHLTLSTGISSEPEHDGPSSSLSTALLGRLDKMFEFSRQSLDTASQYAQKHEYHFLNR